MGCYSFYKIFKDIIKTIFGIKFWRYILIFLSLFIILFILNDNGVLASFDFTHNGNQVSIADLPNSPFNNDDYIFYYNSGNYMVLFVSNPSLVYFNNGQIYGRIGLSVVSYMYISGRWYQSTSFTIDSNAGSLLMNTTQVDNLILTTFDIKDTNGNVIVQGPVTFVYPFISTPTSEIQDLSFINLFVEIGDYDISTPLYLHTLTVDNTVTDNNSTIYYYSDYSIVLDTNSPYYKQFANSDSYYFSIPKYKFSFKPNLTYYFVLSDNPDNYNNSVGLISEDDENGIFQVISFNTTGLITSDDVISDDMSNIQDNLSDTNVSPDISTEIDDTLSNFNNSNSSLNSMNNGFFTRLTSLFSNLVGYDLSADTPVEIPLPNSNKKIILHSNILYNNVNGALRTIINAFWLYIFTFYLYKFINKIYIAVSSGNILDAFSSKGEAITNDML